jgi:hypothetical protein
LAYIHQLALVEFVMLLLAAAHVKPPVQATGNQCQQCGIAQPDHRHPAGCKNDHATQGGGQVVPAQETQPYEKMPPGEKHVEQQVLQRRQGIKRPAIQGRKPDR